MTLIERLIEPKITTTLEAGKSILLMGPRQTGKTTLLTHKVNADLEYLFILPEVRRRYEANPETLIDEIKAHQQLNPASKRPVVLIDEIQKVPAIMDPIQFAIDSCLATFVLTGSSARKLCREHSSRGVNLLPGRVIEMRLDALSTLELDEHQLSLDDLLLNGSLPEIITQQTSTLKESLLSSYVNIYLEEEIRAESLVRNLSSFSRFLAYAATDAGREVNVNNLSEEIGVSRHTITEYYQILLDCLVADRIEPITNTTTRRRLTKAPKYLFFDMGVRRIAAGEGLRLPLRYYGHLFEQFVGLEILRVIRAYAPQASLRYWHDHSGPEVDYIIEYNRQFYPIEVKYTDKPTKGDSKHLRAFMNEYECERPALVVCQTPNPLLLGDDVLAINWRQLPQMLLKYFGG